MADDAQDKPILEVIELYHSFKAHKALGGVSFSVKSNSIHGFVGPNGAGKTTCLRVIATLLKPQSGQVWVFNQSVASHFKEIRRRIGFMPDHFSMYRQMTVFEYLDFFAAAYGLNLAERTNTIKAVLALTDMEGRQHDFIKGLSRGMQQRVSLARVLVHDPDLLLLDEPASGLDPRARIELMEILRELRSMGKTIFISSHILSELAELCDAVTIIDRGRIKYSGEMSGLLSKRGDTVSWIVVLTQAVEGIVDKLNSDDSIESAQIGANPEELRVTVQSEGLDTNGVLRAVMEAGGMVSGFREDVRHLNEAFMELTEAGVRS